MAVFGAGGVFVGVISINRSNAMVNVIGANIDAATTDIRREVFRTRQDVNLVMDVVHDIRDMQKKSAAADAKAGISADLVNRN